MSTGTDALSLGFSALLETHGILLVASPSGESASGVIEDAPILTEPERTPRKYNNAQYVFIQFLRTTNGASTFDSVGDVDSFEDPDAEKTYHVVELTDNPGSVTLKFLCVLHAA